ncbi:TPA: helix-turn-helix domain-containing protein [Streptococcus pyogenes]
MVLGEKIKNHRLNKGMNLREFGEYIDNTSDSIVSRWEKNRSVPKAKRLKLIADDMNITVTELLKDE